MAGYLFSSTVPRRRSLAPAVVVVLATLAVACFAINAIVPTTSAGDRVFAQVRGFPSVHYLRTHLTLLRIVRSRCANPAGALCDMVNTADVLNALSPPRR